MKKAVTGIKIFVIIFIISIVLMFKFCTGNNTPKTKVELLKEQNDSLLEIRKKKIEFALTYLKMTIQKNMKNPDSYEMIERDYDHKDTLDKVKMYIKFRGDNSFGGKSISRVDAVYNFKTDNVKIVNQSEE